MAEEIILKPIEHNKLNCIGFYYKNNAELNSILKAEGARWSQSKSCWYIEESKFSLQTVFSSFKNKAFLNYEAIKNKNSIKSQDPAIISSFDITTQKNLFPLGEAAKEKIILLQKYMRSRRYSENTIKTYCDALQTFLKFYAKKDISGITNQDIIDFNNNYILKNNLSASFQNQLINAVKLFYKVVENTSLELSQLHRPKRSRSLPNVLSKEEVKLILNAPSNIKHKAMLSLIYSCGLRCGETLRLKPEHVDSKRKLLLIKQSKGKKDRIVPLSEKIIKLLRDYYLVYRPKTYLFEGQKSDSMYDERSLQQVLKRSVEKAGIKKPVTLHWLRHSYATHLLENGTDLRYIQEILGHSSSKTTEIYTHVSTKSIQKIISPFDYL